MLKTVFGSNFNKYKSFFSYLIALLFSTIFLGSCVSFDKSDFYIYTDTISYTCTYTEYSNITYIDCNFSVKNNTFYKINRVYATFDLYKQSKLVSANQEFIFYYEVGSNKTRTVYARQEAYGKIDEIKFVQLKASFADSWESHKTLWIILIILSTIIFPLIPIIIIKIIS